MTTTYQICAEHPDLTSPDKRLPCPACLEKARADKAQAAFGPLLSPSPEALEAYQRQAENYPESDMRAVPKQWLLNERSITERVAAELEKERDAAFAEVERLRAASHGLLTEIVRSRKGSIGGIDTHHIVQLRCGQVDALFAALNPAPELWPCGHEKTHPDEVCRECSP